PKGSAPLYGSDVLVWKQGVKDRTTFTPGDSMSTGSVGVGNITGLSNVYALLANGPAVMARWLFAEATGFAHDADIWNLVNQRYFPLNSYYEAQIHGDLSWRDLETVVLTHEPHQDTTALKNVKRQLKRFARHNGYDFRVQIRATTSPTQSLVAPASSLG